MKKGTDLALGAIIGAAVGVVAGVLTAPKSGKETRDDIKQKSGELKGQATKTRDDLLFKAEEIGDDVRVKVVEAIKSVKTPKEKN
jgi:gas vesicle protein